MPLIDLLLPEFDREVGSTRRLLERIPDTALAWRPHERSMTLYALATHVVALPVWVDRVMAGTSFDLDTEPEAADAPTSTDAVLHAFDQHAARARGLLSGRLDGELMAPWTLTRGTTIVMTAPRIVMLRYFMLNHLIHHRGQLTVYLRLRDVPLPAMYGPSADEGTL